VIYLKEKLSLTPEQEEIALYGLRMIVYTATGLFSILFVGWLIGCFATTLTVAMTAAFLRLFSGGAHAKSPLTCTLLGMIMAPAFGKIAATSVPFFASSILALIIVAGLLPSLVLIWRLAPVDSPAKPITSPAERRKFRLLSLLAALSITAGQLFLLLKGEAAAIVLAASLGLWWQTFTLTGAGHRFATLLDNLKERR
jgi:accessory gene regulator B